MSRTFVFTPQQKVLRTACFYCKLHCLIGAFGLCPKVQAPFPVAVTLHTQLSHRAPLSLTIAPHSSSFTAQLLLTHIRVCSRTSVVLLPRFLCFPTRYIIEVAFHPVHPVQPILARTCFFCAATRLTLVYYERSSFICFLQTQPRIFFYSYTNAQCIIRNMTICL